MSKVELFENERASGYDQFVEAWIPNYQYFLDFLPKLFWDSDPSEILVVGCGTGNEIQQLVAKEKKWNVTGIDPSPEMIQQARQKLEGYTNVRLIEALVSDLEVDRKYDAATLLLVLHFLEDNGSKLELLKQIGNRLISGALFVMLDITGDERMIRENLKILRLLLPDDITEEQIDHRLNRIQKELLHVPEDRLAALCVEAGFEVPVRFFQSAIYMGWMTRKK
ncbi:class I SAM-dependent methyltransferase [Sphingobacterium sp. DR205]|uniref:class I SAM-dependent methyltransferase n=1 Tax=Sphingobacterium sp. DR205 TaxID=2713573 RepID=UPI0013E41BC3|nr:class I SAM-dependent methyltransferase [Sphingobacterium sp. DR205]QIH32620.1 class I SAM-dependent methyltransferase [Sphingobacterium sp. DR205]